jgi:peptidoglycan biosynthesis protein MviN/MurJ (putative lipid II flippase)
VITALLSRLAAVHPNHKRIAAGAALIGVLTVIAKLFVAAREMAIAWRYGVGATVDAYQLALTITMWLPMMLISVMTVVLVPRLVALGGRPVEHRSFVAELNGTVLMLGIAVTALTWAAAPAASALLASGSNAATLELTVTMSREMAPVAVLLIVVG